VKPPSANGDYRRYIAVLLVLVVSLTAIGDDNEALLRSLRQAVELNENRLLNLRVDGRCYWEIWDEQAKTWNYGGETTVTAWRLGVQSDKARIDYHQRFLPLEDGPAPYTDESFVVANNGSVNQTLFTKTGVPESPLAHPRGHIDAKREPSLDTECATGWQHSIYGASGLVGGTVRFSTVFAPETRRVVNLRARQTEFNRTACLELKYGIRGFEATCYFDPTRNYAMLGGERSRNGVVIDRWTVEKLLEPDSALYYPAKVITYVFSPNGQPRSRGTYEASTVVANDPNFRDDIFTIQWPVGTVVHDKISGITFTVGQSASDVDKAIADQVKRLKAAVRHPLTPQVKQSGGYWIPARWLAAIAVAAVAVAWLGWWARKQRK
jgi:hypothetical protein